MIKRLLSVIALSAVGATTALAQNDANSSSSVPRKPETPMLKKDDYRQRLEEVIVIGQDPYWRKEGAPRWDRSKVEVEPNAAGEPRLKLFPNYTEQEADEAMKIPDRNNATPKIKIFEKKF